MTFVMSLIYFYSNLWLHAGENMLQLCTSLRQACVWWALWAKLSSSVRQACIYWAIWAGLLIFLFVVSFHSLKYSREVLQNTKFSLFIQDEYYFTFRCDLFN